MAPKLEKTAAPAAEKPAAAATVPPAPAPAAVKPASAVANPRVVAPLTVARWSESQFKQARHAITPEAGTLLEDLADPAYYAHIASKVNAGDIIEVRPADGAYYAEIYVWAKGANWLQVSALQVIRRPGPAAVPAAAKGFSIEFVEGAAKHRVVRNSDRAELARGFETADAANVWLEANKIRIAA